MVEAAGVELDGRSRTGLISRIPREYKTLKSLNPLKSLGASTKQVHGFRQYARIEQRLMRIAILPIQS